MYGDWFCLVGISNPDKINKITLKQVINHITVANKLNFERHLFTCFGEENNSVGGVPDYDIIEKVIKQISETFPNIKFNFYLSTFNGLYLRIYTAYKNKMSYDDVNLSIKAKKVNLRMLVKYDTFNVNYNITHYINEKYNEVYNKMDNRPYLKIKIED